MIREATKLDRQTVLAVENITKKFAGVVALDDVSLELHEGKVTAVIGENGAGKSTLMKILSGVYQEFEGKILLQGKPVHFSNPREAQNNGIAIIHQELNLISCLSISENIFLGREIITQWGTLNHREMRQKTQSLLDELKLAIDPDTIVSKLKVGQQQVVEIAKALLLDSKIIIMDEPTSAISESEVEVLFDIIGNLQKEGKTIVYISHKLDELFKIADRYIILRDGKKIESGIMEDICHNDIIQKMVGRNIQIVRKKTSEIIPVTLLSVKDLSLKHAIKSKADVLNGISFHVGKGEIVGIFGLMGAGRTELLETIFGLHAKLSTGKISISLQEVRLKSPIDAIRAGIGLVPEDRKNDGLILGMDIQSNISLPVLNKIEKLGILDNSKESELAETYIQALNIKTSTPKQAARKLSGGNQQKIVLGKWLATDPKILMLDEPTRGIDVNAKNEIYKLILDLADKGLGIIVVSSEIPEILAISDRILVMAEGSLTAEFPASNASEELILNAAIPQTI